MYAGPSPTGPWACYGGVASNATFDFGPEATHVKLEDGSEFETRQIPALPKVEVSEPVAKPASLKPTTDSDALKLAAGAKAALASASPSKVTPAAKPSTGVGPTKPAVAAPPQPKPPGGLRP